MNYILMHSVCNFLNLSLKLGLRLKREQEMGETDGNNFGNKFEGWITLMLLYNCMKLQNSLHFCVIFVHFKRRYQFMKVHSRLEYLQPAKNSRNFQFHFQHFMLFWLNLTSLKSFSPINLNIFFSFIVLFLQLLYFFPLQFFCHQNLLSTSVFRLVSCIDIFDTVWECRAKFPLKAEVSY